MDKWIPFWFDGNQGFGMMDTPELWEIIKAAYARIHSDPLDALQAPTVDGIVRFGFYPEYKGPRTLREWAKENGITL